MSLPYKGKEGINIINKYRKVLKSHLPENIKPQVVYSSKKLSSKFNLKEKVEFKHQHGLIYKYECPENNCNATYIGETARRISERIKDHYCWDKNSHIHRHIQETGHIEPNENSFSILQSGFDNYKKRKLAEAIQIKKNHKPSLNTQEQSYPLKLFI